MLAARWTANGTSFAKRGGPNAPVSLMNVEGSETSFGIFATAMLALSRVLSSDLGGTGSDG